MRVRLQIDRLVLDGLPLDPNPGNKVKAAVERELIRLIAGEIPRGLTSGGAIPYLRADDMRLFKGVSPDGVGQKIARSVYGGLQR